MTKEITLLPLAQSLANSAGWDGFTRTLMLEGKGLDGLPEAARTQDAAVEGCESPVWVAYSEESHCIKAYSPSKVIRGVLAVLLEKANSLPPLARTTFDFEEYLQQCQLERYLSQSRGNGIRFVIQKLKAI